MERNWVICRDIDRPRDGHIEWGQEKSKYVNAYMWNLEKWYRWIYSQVRNRDADLENECTDTTRGMGWGGMNWEDSADICTPPLLLLKSLQLCLTLCDRVDCSPQGFSVHGILQARILEWVYSTPYWILCVWEYWRSALLQRIFLIQGSNPGLLHYRQLLYRWVTREAPYIHYHE